LEEADTRGLYVAERAAWSLVWLGVLTAGIDVWGFWWSSPFTVALAPLMVLAGAVGLVTTWLVRSPRSQLLQLCAFGGVMMSLLFPEAIVIHTRVFYQTDSAAFDQVSARLLLNGHNPYTASLSSAAHLLSVPARLWTYTTDGGYVAHASYPAGSFLFQVPVMALGFGHMVVDWTDLFAWMVCAALFFVLLPRSIRWLAGLLAMTPMFLGMFSSGGTDAMFLPFLVLAAWRWDRYAQPDAGVARWIGPVALGLACAIKQTPWFCVPMLATGIFMEARGNGRPAMRPTARYLSTVVGVFGVVNLPFIVWQPAAWLHGTLLPFVGGLVADGQGLVTLATHGLSGGVNLTMLSAAALLAYLTVMAAWVIWYPALKRIWPLLIPVVFFFAPRSLSSYLVDLFPVAVIALLSVHGAPAITEMERALSPRGRGVRLLVVPIAAVVVTSALALSSHPLGIKVDGVQTTHAGRRVEAVTVTVHNLTGAPERPHFMVNTGSGTAGFWVSEGGRDLVLAPHGSATVTLDAPVATSTPQQGARWLVEAYISSPRALSTSALQIWRGG
jgi:uncharacterized membrane protein